MIDEKVTLRQDEIDELSKQQSLTKEQQRKIDINKDAIAIEQKESNFLKGMLDSSINKDYAVPIYFCVTVSTPFRH